MEERLKRSLEAQVLLAETCQSQTEIIEKQDQKIKRLEEANRMYRDALKAWHIPHGDSKA